MKLKRWRRWDDQAAAVIVAIIVVDVQLLHIARRCRHRLLLLMVMMVRWWLWLRNWIIWTVHILSTSITHVIAEIYSWSKNRAWKIRREKMSPSVHRARENICSRKYFWLAILRLKLPRMYRAQWSSSGGYFPQHSKSISEVKLKMKYKLMKEEKWNKFLMRFLHPRSYPLVSFREWQHKWRNNYTVASGALSVPIK